MRQLFIASAFVLALSACASQSTPPATPAAAPVAAATPAPAAAVKAPQCWNGDVSAFQDVGTKTTISGVAVSCKPTSDGKSAQWMGAGH